jgi:hypothetical protein
MKDKPYQVGLPDGIGCMLAEKYPDLIPIMYFGGLVASGELVGFAPDTQAAVRMVIALNMEHNIRETWTSMP